MKSSRWKISTVVVPGIVLACLWHPLVSAQSNNQGNASGSATERKQTASAPLGTGAQDFVQQVMEVNQAGTAMAQMAMQQASSAAVKTYARQMLEDHAQARQELESIQATLASGGSAFPGGNSTTAGRTERPATTRDNGQTPARSSTGESRARASGNTGTGNVDYRTDTTGSESGLGVAASPAIGSRMGRTDHRGDPAPGMSSDAYKDYSHLSEKYQVSLNRMKDLSGTEFDREYLSAQITLHRQSIRLLEQQTAGARNSRLKQYAGKHLPQARRHLGEATRIQKSLTGSSTNNGGK